MSNIGSNNCDRVVHVYHSYDHAAQNNAPPARLKSLKQKRALYDDISRRMRRGLYPEDVLTAAANQIVHLASAAEVPVEILAGWFSEEVANYATEQQAGGFENILHLPEPTRPFELKLHLHFAARR